MINKMTTSKLSNVEEEFTLLVEKPIDVMSIILKYLSYWKWFVLSAAFCIVIAVLYIFFSLTKYEIATSIVFKDDQRGGGVTELNVFKEIGVVTRRSNVDNEIEILKKSLIVESVVRELGLYVTYAEMKPILPLKISGMEDVLSKFPHRKASILYGDESPLKLTLSENSMNGIGKPILFDVQVDESGLYTFSGIYKKHKYDVIASRNDTSVLLPFGNLRMECGKTTLQKEMKIQITINNPRDVANNYLN